MADKIKLVVAALLLAGGIAGYYYLADHALIFRVLSVLAGAALGAAVAWMTEPGRHFVAFSQESWAETRKVVWPSRKETLQTTGIVFLLVVVMALFLMMVDAGLAWAVKLLMGRGS